MFYRCTESEAVLEWRTPDFAREASGVRQHLRNSVVLVALATTSALTWVISAGSGAAGAATRSRSGALRDQLVSSSHFAPNGAAAPGLGLTGPDVMAAVVGLCAFFAMAFLVVTLIRRRITVAA